MLTEAPTPRESRLIAPPEPGIYPAVEDETYHSWDCMSRSQIVKRLQGRPLAWIRHQAEQPEEGETSALAVGRAFHLAVFEPDRFGEEVEVGPTKTRTSKAWAEAQADNPGATMVSDAEYEMVQRMTAAVYAKPAARTFLDSIDMVETSVVGELHGCPVKVRLDALSGSTSAILDLKSTRDASPIEFEKAIHNYGYHIQGDLYQTVALQQGVRAAHFVMICAEKEPPYLVAVYRLNELGHEVADQQIRRVLPEFTEAYEAGVWPAYSDEAVDIGVPPWALKQSGILEGME